MRESYAGFVLFSTWSKVVWQRPSSKLTIEGTKFIHVPNVTWMERLNSLTNKSETKSYASVSVLCVSLCTRLNFKLQEFWNLESHLFGNFISILNFFGKTFFSLRSRVAWWTTMASLMWWPWLFPAHVRSNRAFSRNDASSWQTCLNHMLWKTCKSVALEDDFN